MLDVTMVPSIWPFAVGDNLQTLASCQGHSTHDAPSELNLPQRIPSPLFDCTTSATGRGIIPRADLLLR